VAPPNDFGAPIAYTISRRPALLSSTPATIELARQQRPAFSDCPANAVASLANPQLYIPRTSGPREAGHQRSRAKQRRRLTCKSDPSGSAARPCSPPWRASHLSPETASPAQRQQSVAGGVGRACRRERRPGARVSARPFAGPRRGTKSAGRAGERGMGVWPARPFGG
jgi:hypothetical protein